MNSHHCFFYYILPVDFIIIDIEGGELNIFYQLDDCDEEQVSIKSFVEHAIRKYEERVHTSPSQLAGLSQFSSSKKKELVEAAKSLFNSIYSETKVKSIRLHSGTCTTGKMSDKSLLFKLIASLLSKDYACKLFEIDEEIGKLINLLQNKYEKETKLEEVSKNIERTSQHIEFIVKQECLLIEHFSKLNEFSKETPLGPEIDLFSLEELQSHYRMLLSHWKDLKDSWIKQGGGRHAFQIKIAKIKNQVKETMESAPSRDNISKAVRDKILNDKFRLGIRDIKQWKCSKCETCHYYEAVLKLLEMISKFPKKKLIRGTFISDDIDDLLRKVKQNTHFEHVSEDTRHDNSLKEVIKIIARQYEIEIKAKIDIFLSEMKQLQQQIQTKNAMLEYVEEDDFVGVVQSRLGTIKDYINFKAQTHADTVDVPDSNDSSQRELDQYTSALLQRSLRHQVHELKRVLRFIVSQKASTLPSREAVNKEKIDSAFKKLNVLLVENLYIKQSRIIEKALTNVLNVSQKEYIAQLHPNELEVLVGDRFQEGSLAYHIYGIMQSSKNPMSKALLLEHEYSIRDFLIEWIRDKRNQASIIFGNTSIRDAIFNVFNDIYGGLRNDDTIVDNVLKKLDAECISNHTVGFMVLVKKKKINRGALEHLLDLISSEFKSSVQYDENYDPLWVHQTLLRQDQVERKDRETEIVTHLNDDIVQLEKQREASMLEDNSFLTYKYECVDIALSCVTKRTEIFKLNRRAKPYGDKIAKDDHYTFEMNNKKVCVRLLERSVAGKLQEIKYIDKIRNYSGEIQQQLLDKKAELEEYEVVLEGASEGSLADKEFRRINNIVFKYGCCLCGYDKFENGADLDEVDSFIAATVSKLLDGGTILIILIPFYFILSKTCQ